MKRTKTWKRQGLKTTPSKPIALFAASEKRFGHGVCLPNLSRLTQPALPLLFLAMKDGNQSRRELGFDDDDTD